MSFPHWLSEDYTSALASIDEQISLNALEKLVDDIQKNKGSATQNLLNSGHADEIVSNLILWLQSLSSKISGNAAYVLGSLSEVREGCLRILNIAAVFNSKGWMSFPDTLVSMLSSGDIEIILNAAGTLGTIVSYIFNFIEYIFKAELEEGREWLLNNIGDFIKMMEYIDKLLQSHNHWVASNAALILARFSISERGLSMIMQQSILEEILIHSIECLGVYEAGCGMNCAFVLGRICDSPTGLQKIIEISNKDKLLSGIGAMLSKIPNTGSDWGNCKNACFCLSCIASTTEGLRWIVNTEGFLSGDNYLFTKEGEDVESVEANVNRLGVSSGDDCRKSALECLANLLDMANVETSWFAAMAVRSIISQPQGLRLVRRYQPIVQALKMIQNRPRLSNISDEFLRRTKRSYSAFLKECALATKASMELRNEAKTVIRLLSPLPAPSKPRVIAYGQSSALIGWTAIDVQSNVSVSYKLFMREGNSPDQRLVYQGCNTETRIRDLLPYHRYYLTLCGLTEIDEGPSSEPTLLLTEEAIPSAPCGLHASVVTRTQVRIVWSPPKHMNGVLKYYSVRVECQEGRANTPNMTSTSAQWKRPISAPYWTSKPRVSILGRSEVNVSWDKPKLPRGRIMRYEVYLNQQATPVYSGTVHHCRLLGLRPNTEYSFVVTLVTNMGRFDSKPVKKLTPGNEYTHPSRTQIRGLNELRVGQSRSPRHVARCFQIGATSHRSSMSDQGSSADSRTKSLPISSGNSLSLPCLASDTATHDTNFKGDLLPHTTNQPSPGCGKQTKGCYFSGTSSSSVQPSVRCHSSPHSLLTILNDRPVWKPSAQLAHQAGDRCQNLLDQCRSSPSLKSKSTNRPKECLDKKETACAWNSLCHTGIEIRPARSNSEHPPARRRRTGLGFWRRRQERSGSEGSTIVTVPLHGDGEVDSNCQGLYTRSKQSPTTSVWKPFWRKRQPKSAQSCPITTVENPSDSCNQVIDETGRPASVTQLPPTVLVPPSMLEGNDDEETRTRSTTARLSSPFPVTSFHAPLRHSRLNDQSWTLHTDVITSRALSQNT